MAVAVVALIVFVGIQAWPTFEHNGGVKWLGSGGNVEEQIANMQATGPNPPASAYYFRAWPLIYGTIIITAPAVLLGLVISILSSIFIVELAPAAACGASPSR